MSSDRDLGERTLADVGEGDLLSEIFPDLPAHDGVLIAPGDDTALLRVSSREALLTTDTMVLGRDWLDEWSSAEDVAAKCVAQNLADIAAMGGRTTGVLVTLVAARDLPVAWVRDFSRGVADACRAEGVAVLGGDLSSAPAGVRMVSITAVGELPGPAVLRSGARPGDVVAVNGSLGWSAAGFLALERGERGGAQVSWHRRPAPAYADGPRAAAAGATAMLDISDGLVRDAGRIAAASGVSIDLSETLLRPYAADLTDVAGDRAWECVLTGGEEHTLLATYPSSTQVPEGWQVIGEVVAAGLSPVTVDGRAQTRLGWDHFGG